MEEELRSRAMAGGMPQRVVLAKKEGGQRQEMAKNMAAAMKEAKATDRKLERPNPLAGRAGEGAPIAPPGWRWKAGNRSRDMYFYSPSGLIFRSQPHLQSYLANLADPPPLHLFRFKINPSDFKDGNLPGTLSSDARPSKAPYIKRHGEEVQAPAKRRKITIKLKGVPSQLKYVSNGFGRSNEGMAHHSQPQTNGSPLGNQKSENHAEKVNPKEIDHSSNKGSIDSSFKSLVLGSASYSVLSKNAEVLQKFLDEAERLKERDQREIKELRSELLNKKLSTAQLNKYPESALHVFYFILRNEEAPASFGKEELIEFCRKWICKHKHYWCLLETSRFDTSVEPSVLPTLKGQAQAECTSSSMHIEDEISVPQSAKGLALNPGKNSKGTTQQNTEDLHDGGESKEAKPEHGQLLTDDKSKPPADICSCRVCLRDTAFCYGCTCSICKVFIQHSQSWTYIKCPICGHFCHLQCALKALRGGVVPELGLDGEFLCPCCLQKSDLVPFWIDRLKDALSSVDRSAVQKYLTSAVLVLNGTQRQDFEAVHRNVMELHDSLLYNTPCPNLQQILEQIQKKVDSLSTPLERTDVQDAEILQEEENLLEELKCAELDYVEWLIAEKNVDSCRMILRDAQEEMKKAETDVNAKAACARASRFRVQRAAKKLQLLKRNNTMKALSKEQVEKQKAAYDLELAERNRLQDKLGSLSSEPNGISAPQMSSLLQDYKVQNKRVETVKSRLEQIDSLSNFFSVKKPRTS